MRQTLSFIRRGNPQASNERSAQPSAKQQAQDSGKQHSFLKVVIPSPPAGVGNNTSQASLISNQHRSNSFNINKAEKIEITPLVCGISALFLGIGVIFGTYNVLGKDDHILRLLTTMSINPSRLNNIIASSTIITLCSVGFVACAAVCLKHIYKSFTTKAPEPSTAISLGLISSKVGSSY
jgi:hypothetical protein